jgi:4'-phosphopantetheinyl transferase
MTAESTLIEHPGSAATQRVEEAFAELLAGALGGDGVSVDSHFFEELGADSLVMARFCARVSKREDLPSVSIRDVYRHPTIRSLAADLLGRYLQVPPGRIRYRYNAFGKPDLAHEFGGRIRFNLSHAGGLALIAIAAESDVGVDLEFVETRADYQTIARSFFSAAEADPLGALAVDRRAEAFLGCWTKKEACLKACGAGLAIPLDRVVVPVDPARDPVDVHVRAYDLVPATRWSVYTLRPAPGYVGALAIGGGCTPRLREYGAGPGTPGLERFC